MATANTIETIAAKRLMRELRVYHSEPVPGCTVAPHRDDIFRWRCTVSVPECASVLPEVKFDLVFPPNYPSAPPRLLLHTGLPTTLHPSVVRGMDASIGNEVTTVCLDMLSTSIAGLDVKHAAGVGWRPAYTVAPGVMMQLQAFIIELTNSREGSDDNTPDLARDFQEQEEINSGVANQLYDANEEASAHLQDCDFSADIDHFVQMVVAAPEASSAQSLLSAVNSQESNEGSQTVDEVDLIDIDGWHTAVNPRKVKKAAIEEQKSLDIELAVSNLGRWLREQPVALADSVQVSRSQQGSDHPDDGQSNHADNASEAIEQFSKEEAPSSPVWEIVQKGGRSQQLVHIPTGAIGFFIGKGGKRICNICSTFSVDVVRKISKDSITTEVATFAIKSTSSHSQIEAAVLHIEGLVHEWKVKNGLLSKVDLDVSDTVSTTSSSSSSATVVSAASVCDHKYPGITGASLPLTKAAKKNKVRAERRKAQQQLLQKQREDEAAAAESINSDPVKPKAKSVHHHHQQQQQQQQDDRQNQSVPSLTLQNSNDVMPVSEPMTKAAKKNLRKKLAKKKRKQQQEDGQKLGNEDFPSGTSLERQVEESTFPWLEHLPLDIQVNIFHGLPLSINGALGCCSRRLKQSVDDGQLWRRHFQTRFPRSLFTAAGVQDWRHCFRLEQENTLASLACFYSRVHFLEDNAANKSDGVVLGMPLKYTVNPKTKEVDYIYCSPDLMSLEVYNQLHQTAVPLQNSDKEQFSLLLPAYLSQQHFERALPQIKKVFTTLAPPGWKNKSTSSGCGFDPILALEVLPRAMNTLTVLVSDGAAAPEKLLSSFAMLHRLLLAFSEAYPEVEVEASRRLTEFVEQPRRRWKDVVHNLGCVLPLTMASDALSWKQVIPAVMQEKLDRNVLWACRDYPELEKCDGPGAVTLKERLEKTFEASKVSNRLTMFMSAFVRLVGRPSGLSLGDVAARSDALYGLPDAGTYAMFKEELQKIMICSSWPAFCSLAGLQCPSPSDLGAMLVSAVKNSAKKGYHKPGMDFSRVQRSGVSAILLKGESYNVQPNVKHVRLENVWNTVKVGEQAGNGHFGNGLYLDASCIVMGFNGRRLGVVDYMRTDWGGALRHSGDIMDVDKQEGKHTITVDLSLLPSTVSGLFFVLSSWQGPKLRDVRQPYIRLCDSDAEDEPELCRYEQDHENVEKGHTSAIMCWMHRCSQHSGWTATAPGITGTGYAGNYKNIFQQIDGVIAGSRGRS